MVAAALFAHGITSGRRYPVITRTRSRLHAHIMHWLLGLGKEVCVAHGADFLSPGDFCVVFKSFLSCTPGFDAHQDRSCESSHSSVGT